MFPVRKIFFYKMFPVRKIFFYKMFPERKMTPANCFALKNIKIKLCQVIESLGDGRLAIRIFGRRLQDLRRIRFRGRYRLS